MRSCLSAAPSARSRSRCVSPLIAIALTLVTMASCCSRCSARTRCRRSTSISSSRCTDPYSLQEIVVKATPLVLIAVGLSLCYLANVWNIGAEGQFLIGAVAGCWLAVDDPRHRRRSWVLPAMLVARRARRRALCADPGALQDALRRERNPHQPDAGLCRRAAARLSGARSVARPEGLQFPDDGRVRRRSRPCRS